MRIAAALLSACLAVPAFGQSHEHNGDLVRSRGRSATDQIIIKWHAAPAVQMRAAAMQKLGASSGVRLQRKHQISEAMEVLQLDHALGGVQLHALLTQVAADPAVEYAVADERRYIHAVPADLLFTEQWYFHSLQPAATRTEQAWDVTPGSNTTVVAVLDTGVRFEHPDLRRVAQGGKLLDGFDFVSNVAVANDGTGRDGDAADPGDWVTSEDTQQPPFDSNDCIPAERDRVDSSWHGTRVASLIAALTNNTEGLAGAAWNTLILPVRVLGKCGGTDSDILAGIRWAAGLAVPGAPVNANPAQIINLSLGGSGTCSAAYQSTIDELAARGVLVVASVGNEGTVVGAPANCAGVLGVAGLRHAGTKVGFSNLGPGTDLGAPGGNCVDSSGTTCQFYIAAAKNAGFTTPTLDNYTTANDRDSSGASLAPNVGTSFSAPLVAGAAALMRSLNTQLNPAQYIALLRESATPFPTSSATTTRVCHVPSGADDLQQTECICTPQTCGAGMLNTHAAVLAAQRPFAVVNAPGTIGTDTDVTIDARGSFAANNRSISSYQWSATGISGATPVFASASEPLTTLRVPGASTFTLRLTVTDDQGVQDTADVMATAAPPAPAPVPSPTPLPSSGGGGGSFGWLLALVALGLARGSYAQGRRRG